MGRHAHGGGVLRQEAWQHGAAEEDGDDEDQTNDGLEIFPMALTFNNVLREIHGSYSFC